jgi:dihydroorotate dehydrogenase electron transfer subunit
MKQINAAVQEKTTLSPGISRIVLNAPYIAANAIPGQFIMVNCGQGTILRRPVSIHNIHNKESIVLLVKTIGTGTGNIADRKPGDSINLIGPLGNGFKIADRSRKILLIAGGIGIAPMIFLADRASQTNIKVTLFMGADTATQLYPEELAPKDTEYFTATVDGSAGKKGLITDYVADVINNHDQVFACGPVNMYKTLNNLLPKIHYTNNLQVSLEVRMGCGFGICYGCTIKTKQGMKQVCKDGPIFDIKQINWEWVKV